MSDASPARGVARQKRPVLRLVQVERHYHDAAGKLSILSGAHMTLVPRILDGLRENGAEDVLVVLGGTIPAEDAEELKRQGVAAVFTPGAPTSEIVDFLKGKVPA